MARRRKSDTPTTDTDLAVADYRFDAKRKNNPPAGLAAQGKVQDAPRIRYEYNPHLPPVLRFDASGKADALPELLQAARQRPLTAEEVAQLAAALKRFEPWLEWAGKREAKGFAVEPVALHIHERISTQAILRVASRQDVQRDLFADPQQDYREAVQFYRHEVDWANRMILGDSLQVMASLARREDLAGKVQMIYIDPPYGIKFASNFQPEVGKRDVKDKETDLTREPEMVKAYRDTWTLGVHSYLAYLRDRFMAAKELLADTGSIFVQISDENLHRVRMLLDEIFGGDNFVSLISFATTTGFATNYLPNVADHVLWYAKDKEKAKFRQIYREKIAGEEGATKVRPLADISPELAIAFQVGRVATSDQVTSQGATATEQHFEMHGKVYLPPSGMHWKTSVSGLNRLRSAHRLKIEGQLPRYVRLFEDFNVFPVTNLWLDIGGVQNRTEGKIYVVQTATPVIERCLLMTTDPGDLVLDPTCGSGTTAFVAEQWGRRWITIDTSRVALAIARQRLLTARFDYYELRPINDADARRNPTGPWLKSEEIAGPATLDCETVPHITLKSIAQNAALDPIFEKHKAILDERLAALNAALAQVKPDLRHKLKAKLAAKEKTEGKRAITEADRRRWLLPPDNRAGANYTTVPMDFVGWYEWEVPYDTDPDWDPALQDALVAYRAAWRAKMDEVNAAIAANAENEELVDKPKVRKGVVRVAGPFTVEAVMPAELTLEEETPIEQPEGDLTTFAAADEPANAEAFLDKMLRLLKADGVQFPNNKKMSFTRLEAVADEFLHAEGEWVNGDGKPQSVAVSVGPEFGPVTAYQVENALAYASRRGFENLVFAGFAFDGAAQAIIQDDPNPRVRCHLAHIRPDVQMDGLLKETPNSQLFTVFGSPRTTLQDAGEGMFRIALEGVDIYNPVENTITATRVDKVAAWFVDSDYDGRTFCITQAFFPDKSAWEKLAKALKGVIDESAFDRLSGTVSLPFPVGKHKRAAVKVIDPRGNEVMRVHRLGEGY